MTKTANLLVTSNGICLVSVQNVQYQHKDKNESQKTVLTGGNVLCISTCRSFWSLCSIHQIDQIILWCVCIYTYTSTYKVPISIHWTMHQTVCFFDLQFANSSSNAQIWDELPLLTLHKSAGLPGCKMGLATITQPLDDACISFNNGQLFCRPLKVTRSSTSRSGPPNTSPRTCPRIH